MSPIDTIVKQYNIFFIFIVVMYINCHDTIMLCLFLGKTNA